MKYLIVLMALVISASCSLSDKENIDSIILDCEQSTNDYSSVISSCSKLKEKSKGNKELILKALFFRAQAYLKIQSYGDAIRDLNKAIELNPIESKNYALRGIVHAETYAFEKSIVDFHKAIELTPNDYASFSNLATSLDRSGDQKSALLAYDAAIKLKPDFQAAYSGRCWVKTVLGEDLDHAEIDCNEAIRLDPQDANSYNNRGFINFRLGNFDESISDYDMAISKNDKVASSYYVRGLAKIANNQRSEGSTDIDLAKSMEPNISKRYEKFGISIKTR